MIQECRSVQCAKPDCPKCLGAGVYKYTPVGTAHWTPCDLCCPHDQGYWQLREHYGERNNMWCCLAGCGHVLEENPNAVV